MTIVNRTALRQASKTASRPHSHASTSSIHETAPPLRNRWMSALGFQGNPMPCRTEGKTLRKTFRPLTDPPPSAPVAPRSSLPPRPMPLPNKPVAHKTEVGTQSNRSLLIKAEVATRSRRFRWEPKLPSLVTEALLTVFNHYWEGEVVPAVFHDRQFYILKASYGDSDRLQAFSDAMELMQEGTATLLTKVPSGYRLWLRLCPGQTP